ncbi:trichohyalin-like [Plakobranchus ocellatus]|uniref:Trichohyalin-like n=1 Tax=Plakobranchus ocellatus TaxID=259542 RepID=A0AAV4ATC3_9GAST|nr:trichohyalin-like [Plakobranchus ocellatus]
MGCSASVISPEEQEQIKRGAEKNNNNQIKQSPDHNLKNGHIQPHPPPYKKRELPVPNQGHSLEKKVNKTKSLDQTPVPKSVAFDITLDGESGDGLLRVKKRPPRLQALEPLNLPTLTAEQLAEKQRLADAKRERIKQKKIKASQKSSRRRQELLKAREFGMKQQMEQEKNTIDDSLKQAEIKREQRLIEIKEKQRIREERAKRARERAKQIQNPDDEVEVEKDEEFNAVSDDSWLDHSATAGAEAEKSQNQDVDIDEEEGIQKKVRQVRPIVSASTVDSFDGAFSRGAPKTYGIESGTHNEQLKDDADFFGS